MACAVAQLTPISLGSSSAWATCTCWRSSGPCIYNTKVSVGLAEPCSDHRLRLLRVLIMPDGPWLSVACVSLSLSSCFAVNRADYQRSRAPLNPLPAFKKLSFGPIIITTTAFCRYQVAQIWPWMYTEIGWLRWWCVCVCVLACIDCAECFARSGQPNRAFRYLGFGECQWAFLPNQTGGHRPSTQSLSL